MGSFNHEIIKIRTPKSLLVNQLENNQTSSPCQTKITTASIHAFRRKFQFSFLHELLSGLNCIPSIRNDWGVASCTNVLILFCLVCTILLCLSSDEDSYKPTEQAITGGKSKCIHCIACEEFNTVIFFVLLAESSKRLATIGIINQHQHNPLSIIAVGIRFSWTKCDFRFVTYLDEFTNSVSTNSHDSTAFEQGEFLEHKNIWFSKVLSARSGVWETAYITETLQACADERVACLPPHQLAQFHALSRGPASQKVSL